MPSLIIFCWIAGGGNDDNLKQHVLAPARGHNLDKDAFVNFLKQGLEEYKKRGQ